MQSSRCWGRQPVGVRGEPSSGWIPQRTVGAGGEPAVVGDNSGTGAASGEDAVQIFRNVDGNEFDAIAESGTFATKPGMMEGKWFATTGENAEQWGTMLNAGRGLTVETRVPRSVVNQLHFTGGNLDGVGPGWYADSSLLSLINQHMDGIRVWP